MRRSLSDILREADERSQHSLAEHEAVKELYRIPWLDVDKHGLPKNASEKPISKRRKYLVKTVSGCLYVSLFGYHGLDVWITPTGQLLTPDFGHIVIHWAPLPPTPDFGSGQSISAPVGGGSSPNCTAIPESR